MIGGYGQTFMSKLFLVLFALLNAGTALASETLFYIVKKSDWLTRPNKTSFRPMSLSETGYIQLSTREQVIPTANTLFRDKTDLLLLKIEIPDSDPLLKWENVADCEGSCPHYYGELATKYVRKVYAFKPKKDGRFTLPDDPFLKRMVAWAIPKSTVNQFLYYQDWQKTDRLHKLQAKNFTKPKVQLQWWYFDFFLSDGSSVVMGFIPQDWWSKPKSGKEKKSLFTMALKTRDGVVKRFLTEIPQAAIKTSADRLEVPSRFVIQANGSGNDRTYSIKVNFPEIAGVFDITPTKPPFAAFPTGVMPGILVSLMSGAHLGSPSFSYVSQIPQSNVSGSLTWAEYKTKIEGQAYHEQGRLDDTPDRQGGSWTWYHFSGDGWNIFGSPGSYIYLQQGDQIVRAGFHILSKQYTLQNRTFSSPDHAKILTGGEISFRHENLTFHLKLPPATSKTLICYPSPDPNQVWGTVGGPATLSISEGSTTKTLEGRMFLETCSWETSKRL